MTQPMQFQSTHNAGAPVPLNTQHVQVPVQQAPVQYLQQPAINAQQQPPVQAPVHQQGVVFVDANGQQVQPAAPAYAPVPQTPQQAPAPVSEPVVPSTGTAEAQVQVFLDKAGIQTAQVEQEIIAFGKLTDGTFKALVDKHGQATANLVANQISSIAASRTAVAGAAEKTILDTVQTSLADLTQQPAQESWTELKQWAGTNIDVDSRAELNSMMKQGGMQAKMAVEYIVGAYRKGNNVASPAALVDGEQTPAPGAPLDRKTYLRELDKAMIEFGEHSPQVQQLNARRTAALANGG